MYADVRQAFVTVVGTELQERRLVAVVAPADQYYMSGSIAAAEETEVVQEVEGLDLDRCRGERGWMGLGPRADQS